MATKRNAKRSNLIAGLGVGEEALHAQIAKSMLEVRGIPPQGEPEKLSFAKSIINSLNGPDGVHRLAFEEDPSQYNNTAAVYKAKLRLVPDYVLKRIAIQDSLVATIVRARQEQVSVFGRPRRTRFDNGFEIAPKPGVTSKMTVEEKSALKKQIQKAIVRLSKCGDTEGLDEDHHRSLSEWLTVSVRSAIVVGRIATEICYVKDETGRDIFHHFVATDAGTIAPATNDQQALRAIRREAYHLISTLTGEKLTPEPRRDQENADYAWVEVIEGAPKQVFTNDEMKVYSFYPVPDYELAGYPVTPLDTVITAVTTHLNITTHNKLYFQSGRATRGMLVLKSDDATPQAVNNMKQHFNNSINSVNNSWRMPVLACGVDEDIKWTPIDSGGSRDMEFQYLTDMNHREIMSAFMMSPDELPGYAYLSRGTNNQALSEGNNEYKLEAARDLGIRPLLSKFEDFINIHLLPLVAPDLASMVEVRLVGLDSDNAEKEAVRTQQDMGIWMHMDDVMERVEKEPLGKEWCGTIPLNQAFLALLYKHKTVGEIEEHFLGIPNASKDPMRQYRADPFFFQWMQVMQAQQPSQGPQDSGGSSPGGQPPPDDQGAPSQSAPTEKQKTEQSSKGADDLARSVDVAFDAFSKSEETLPAHQRRILGQRRVATKYLVKGLQDDAKDAVAEILRIAERFTPKT